MASKKIQVTLLRVVVVPIFLIALIYAGEKKEVSTKKDTGTKKVVFEENGPIMFQDDFQSGLDKWKITMDEKEDINSLGAETFNERLQIVDAPDSEKGRKAVRCFVPYNLGTFRSEISLPPEEGFHERWYGVRIYVPTNWVSGSDSGGDTVMQWHGLTSKEMDSSQPPLAISILHDRWVVHLSYGPPKKVESKTETLDKAIEPGHWVSFVTHVNWNSGDTGLVEIWKDGKKVFTHNGPNTYLIKPVTPYYKTGIYHPKWKVRNKATFSREDTGLTAREIFTADVKVGNENAKYEDIAPKP